MPRAGFSPDHGGRHRPPYEEAKYTGNPESFGTHEPISESEIRSIVQRELDSSIGWENARLSEMQRKSLNEYMGNSRGDEREGRSAVVTREVFEQVEWALPAMMEIFTAGSEVCRFVPNEKATREEAERSEELAKQATDGCNHVFRKEGGFMALYTAMKDAFIQKVGVIKVYWEAGETASIETYEGKTFQELMQLESDPSFEVRELTAIDPETEQEVDLETMPLEAAQLVVYDIRGVRRNLGYVKLENIPPEEFLINRDCRGLKDETCRFAAHRIPASESLLVSWGFDPEVVRRLPGAQSVYNTDQDAIIRSSQDDSHPLVYSYRQDSERTLYVNDCYVKLDSDGDGISEWWHVIAAGEYAQELLSAHPCDGHPFAGGTAIPIPHRFYGFSLADVTTDIQNINTTLWRQALDGAYLANDPRHVVLSMGGPGDTAVPQVNLEQLSRSVPGLWVEEYQPGAVRPLDSKSAAPDLLPLIEFHRQRAQDRTGISPESQGVNPQAISKHVFGAMIQSNAAQQRLVLFARIFAETLVLDLFRLIYKTLCQYATVPFWLKLRGEWVEVDPSSWEQEMDCTIAVGLGHGSRMERVNNLTTIATVQEKLLQGGYRHMVSDENLYNTGASLTEALGFKDPEKFFTDPESEEGRRMAQMLSQQTSPAQQAIQLQQMIEGMRVEIDRQKVESDRFKALMDAKKKEWDHEIELAKVRLEGAEVQADNPEVDIFKAAGGA